MSHEEIYFGYMVECGIFGSPCSTTMCTSMRGKPVWIEGVNGKASKFRVVNNQSLQYKALD